MAAPAKPVKQKAWRFGQFAETIAVWYLRVRGYRVLARRFRCRAGEIDIVARRRRLLVFVEVKARRHLAAAADALRPRQAARITRAAEAFVQAHRSLAGLDQRFDVILVVPRRWPVHLVDAWRPEF
ncbi:MAG: YraN family protein [Rhodospirillales bacterium]|jgi:putative endonuclease|nr:YraN family protein [Rhodospirillales bacterium]